jgi:hypothetical protein
MISTQQQRIMNAEFLIPVACFATIFGMVYISVASRHRQRMAMIEKGMDPTLIGGRPEPYRSLRNGMFLVAIGLGLLFGHMLDQAMFAPEDDQPTAYFIMIMLCGGSSLILYHLMVRNKQQG